MHVGSDGTRTGPNLLHSAKMVGRFVWRAARRDFLISVAAEAVGVLGLAGVLLYAQQVAAKLTDARTAELSDVLPATLGLGLSLGVVGLSATFVHRARWLVAEQVTRHVEDEIVRVTTAVDYEMYERQDFHDLLNRSNSQAAESSYRMAYEMLNIFNVLATSVVVVVVLVRSVPEVLGVLVLIAVPSVIAARLSARLAYQTTYQLTPNDRLRLYLYGALSEKREARELRVFALGKILHDRWSVLYADRLRRIRGLVRRQVLFDGLATLIGALLVGDALPAQRGARGLLRGGRVGR